MTFRNVRGGWNLLTLLTLTLAVMPAAGAAGENQKPKPPIDLDRALQPDLPQDRAQAYYYFSLAQWFEANGNLDRALSHMRTALRYDQESSTLRLELAGLLLRSGNTDECIETAREAARINPKDPEIYWLLANVYLQPEGRSRRPTEEAYRKAVKELETMREVAPDDERPYFRLGEAYLGLNETQKAIEAFEKFHALVPNMDAGYLALAGHFERAGDEQKKIEYLKKALEQNPESPQALIGLATTYARQNKDKEAIPLFRRALEVADGNPLIKKQMATSMINVGDSAGALPILEELSRIDPRDPSTKVLTARAYIGERRYKEALEILKAVVNEEQGYVEAEYYLGVTHEQSGDLGEAARIFGELVSKAAGGSQDYSGNLEVFQQHLASVYQQMGESGKTIAVYEEMIKDKPDPDPRIMLYLINALRIDRQLDRAVALSREQHAKHPEDTGITLVYSRTLADMGKIKEGAELLQKLLASDSSNTDIHINLSQIYLQGERYRDAEQVLERALASGQDRERIQVQLATIYEKQKDYDRAESLLRDLLKEDPEDAIALNFLGYMLADRGVRLEEAIGYIQEALDQEPSNGAYLDSLGWAYYRMGKLDKAEEYLLRAIEQIKNDPVIYDHLGDLYSQKGDLAKAEDYWQKSVRFATEADERKKVEQKLEKLQESLAKQKQIP